MIKNIIFDLGNVLARFYADELTAPYATDEKAKKAIGDVVFDRKYWDRLDKGAITDDEVKEDVCNRLPGQYHQPACATYDNWVKNLTPVAGMTELVKDLAKTDKKLFLLSNISIYFANTYSQVPWLVDLFSLFDGIVLSGPIAKIKPDAEIYEHLLNKFNLSAGECLFIDDTVKNIEGAKQVGIKGYVFDGDADKLRKYLSEI